MCRVWFPLEPTRKLLRATFAVVAWLLAWAVLHTRWRDRHVESGRICTLTLLLIAIGILATFPPSWELL